MPNQIGIIYLRKINTSWYTESQALKSTLIYNILLNFIIDLKMIFKLINFLFLFKVGVDGLTYAGCHGLKIIHPDGQRYIHHVEQVIQILENNLT
jgi:hypothetical protein